MGVHDSAGDPQSLYETNTYMNRRYELAGPSIIAPIWLSEWFDAHKISLWGAADLRHFSTPQNAKGQRFLFALSWAIPMNSQIMVSIHITKLIQPT